MKNANELTDKMRKYIFLCIIISCIANTFLATALTTALPSIMVDLNISTTTGQWLTSGYSLAMGIVMPITAFLITRFSTRKLYISAIGISIIGLVMAGFAGSFTVLMASRIFQAVGNGLLSAMAQVILLSIYPLEKRGSVMGWYGLSQGVAPIIAPTLSGVTVDLFNWRTIFYITLIIMTITFIFAIKVFEDVLETKIIKFDTLSFVISGFAFTGITLGIGNIGAYEFTSFFVVGSLLIGIIATLLFTHRQLRIDEPFLDLKILKSKNFAIAVVCSMLLSFVMMGPSIIMPLYIQSILEKSATISGLVMLPGSLCMLLVSPYAGKIYDKMGIKLLFIVGSIILVLSSFIMSTVALETTLWVAVFCNAIRNVAIACIMMPLVTWGIGSVKSTETAHASAIISALRAITSALGSAVFLNLMNYVAKMGVSPMSKVALLHGASVSYLGIGSFAIIMVIIGLFLIIN